MGNLCSNDEPENHGIIKKHSSRPKKPKSVRFSNEPDAKNGAEPKSTSPGLIVDNDAGEEEEDKIDNDIEIPPRPESPEPSSDSE